MTGLKANRMTLWTIIFALIVITGLPTLASAQGRGRGRGQDKKAEKFRNGHDARDGRWDGRGPRHNRDDRFDDDDDDFNRRGGRRRSNRQRDDNFSNRSDRVDAQRAAQANGYREGLRAGSTDSSNGERYNFRDEGAYYDATRGYRNSYGSLDFYRRSFRAAFQRGYSEGYRNRRSRGGIFSGFNGW
jgi:hypothetical protein